MQSIVQSLLLLAFGVYTVVYADTFGDVSLVLGSTSVQETGDFSIEIALTRSLYHNESMVIELPKFYGNTNNDLVISPSSLLIGSWVSLLVYRVCCIIIYVYVDIG